MRGLRCQRLEYERKCSAGYFSVGVVDDGCIMYCEVLTDKQCGDQSERVKSGTDNGDDHPQLKPVFR
ncbi:hypothetical protein PoB_007418600 [Plakobranchus ocellatus]|uniref:Uncharacterized protein n=1 Tax=Plakobranchus ocellatus TaxID=259542 RepID=A0AAV4DUT9_9GAST|nr:hypothetical protein PoB_007418600 [Plakobranchus ocellatus]